ncbi:aminodeoxychorismate synthase component I [Novosphingobium resinovorum]|uniref:aminodeoxychorismate synthase component I n=1 Tax=Novosphingobium resinovorum TaxID=158500 RepID=UPI002ED50443|nr:aminodeoxychorismate synthase component I [Novosphingobium resinovorum]
MTGAETTGAPAGWADLWADLWGDAPATAGAPSIGEGDPFVLLDDARAAGNWRLFKDPREIVVAHAPGEVGAALERLRAGVQSGFHAAGYLAYEAGLALEPRLAELQGGAGETPLVWFGLFDAPQDVPPPPGEPAPRAQLSRALDEAQYTGHIRDILGLIEAGDCYQVNFTLETMVRSGAAPSALFGHLRKAQRAGWGGMLSTGTGGLLSCSPELFFAMRGGEIWTRPMKGTAPRAACPAADEARREALRVDPKERAENLMIVDLLRNDLSRVSRPGSVRVDELFAIESYPTVHQMTSTVRARLEPGLDAVDVIAHLFPCGSVTGAPKIRAMEIIAATERRVRGAYTGSMGVIAPDGRAAFNVLIRTLEFERPGGAYRLGVGSGIVHDSDPLREWRECGAKIRFVDPVPAW